MPMKLSQERVKEIFASFGLTLIGTYVNRFTPVKFICKCSREDERTLCSLTSNKKYIKSGCKVCTSNSRRKIFQTKFEDVKKYFSDHGCVLLSTEYINYDTHLDYICKCGRPAKISYGHFKDGERCRQCALESKTGPNSHFWKDDREAVKLRKLLNKKYYAMLRISLKASGLKKNTKSSTLLGYTPDELRARMTSHPNWENVKNTNWSVDHIFPIKAFIDHKITDIKIINALDNLQPLTKSQNSSKSDNYDPVAFEKWLKKKTKKKKARIITINWEF